MSSQPQSINVTSVGIVPIQIKPACDILLVVPGRTSTIQYLLGQRIPGSPGTPAIPGVVGCGAVLDAKGNVVTPAINGKPAIPEVPAVPDQVIPVDQGTIEMTDSEWTAWTNQDDNTYRTSIVAARLGLTTLTK